MSQHASTVRRQAPLQLRKPWGSTLLPAIMPRSLQILCTTHPGVILGSSYISHWARRAGRERAQLIMTIFFLLFSYWLSSTMTNPFPLFLWVCATIILLTSEIAAAQQVLQDRHFLARLPIASSDILIARVLFALRTAGPYLLGFASGTVLGRHTAGTPGVWLLWLEVLLLALGLGLLLFPYKSAVRVLFILLISIFWLGRSITISPGTIVHEGVWLPVYWIALILNYRPGFSLAPMNLILGEGVVLGCGLVLVGIVWVLNLCLSPAHTQKTTTSTISKPRFPIPGHRVPPVVGWTLALFQQHRPPRILLLLLGGFAVLLPLLSLNTLNQFRHSPSTSMHVSFTTMLPSLAGLLSHEMIFLALTIVAFPLFGTWQERRALQALPLQMESMLLARWIGTAIVVLPLLLEQVGLWWFFGSPTIGLVSGICALEVLFAAPLLLFSAFMAAKSEVPSAVDRLMRVVILAPYHLLFLICMAIGIATGNWLVATGALLCLDVCAGLIGWRLLCMQYARWS